MQQFLKSYDICLSYIQNQQLIKGLNEIDFLVEKAGNWALKQEKINLQRNYVFLLQYFKQGAKDPERELQRNKIIQQSLGIIDLARQYYTITHGTSVYAEQIRSCKTRSFNLKSTLDETSNLYQKALLNDIIATEEQKIQTQKEIEEIHNELFNQIWISEPWNSSQSKTALNFLENAANEPTTKKIIISSVTLACLHLFDAEKIGVLLQSAHNSDRNIYIRALVGLVLIITSYNERLKFYPELTQQLQKLKEIKNIEKDFSTIQIQLLNIHNLATIKETLNKDLIPGFASIRQAEDIEKIQEILSDDMPESLENDEEAKNLKKHIKNIRDMHKKGIDLPYFTFSGMKSVHFFHLTSNWFLPFNEEHSMVREFLKSSGTFMPSFIKANKLCNSDQYSLCFFLKMMSQMERNMTFEMLKKQLDEDNLENVELPEESVRHTDRLRFYLHDCFRYFNLSQRQEEYIKPFSNNHYLFNNPYLKDFFTNKELLLQMAYYAHHYNMRLDAINILEYIDTHFNLDLEALEIYGDNLIKQKEYNKAILCFEKASLITTDSKWVLNNLAFCYLKTGNLQKAFLTYSQLLHVYPNEYKAVLRYGECLYLMGKYDKAIAQFHKVEYFEPNHPKATQAIAYCSLLNMDAIQADKYYDKLQNIKMNKTDFRNAAHAAWLTGNAQKALDLYKKAKTESGITFTQQEIVIFNTYGVENNDIQLLQDIIDLE